MTYGRFWDTGEQLALLRPECDMQNDPAFNQLGLLILIYLLLYLFFPWETRGHKGSSAVSHWFLSLDFFIALGLSTVHTPPTLFRQIYQYNTINSALSRFPQVYGTTVLFLPVRTRRQPTTGLARYPFKRCVSQDELSWNPLPQNYQGKLWDQRDGRLYNTPKNGTGIHY